MFSLSLSHLRLSVWAGSLTVGFDMSHSGLGPPQHNTTKHQNSFITSFLPPPSHSPTTQNFHCLSCISSSTAAFVLFEWKSLNLQYHFLLLQICPKQAPHSKLSHIVIFSSLSIFPTPSSPPHPHFLPFIIVFCILNSLSSFTLYFCCYFFSFSLTLTHQTNSCHSCLNVFPPSLMLSLSLSLSSSLSQLLSLIFFFFLSLVLSNNFHMKKPVFLSHCTSI